MIFFKQHNARILLYILTMIFLLGNLSTAMAKYENSIVYIICKDNNGETLSAGSGVIVSKSGKSSYVITAKHVLPHDKKDKRMLPTKEFNCAGSIGIKDPNNARPMVLQPTNIPVDVALLRIYAQENDAFVPYCQLEDWMKGRNIVVAGFPGRTRIGMPSFRAGILSTTLTNDQGLIEADSQTVSGMSGGPVFSKNFNGFIAIISGAKYLADGSKSYYILPLNNYIKDLKLTVSNRPCYHQAKTFISSWNAGDNPLNLGVSPEEGICFLNEVWGLFNHPEDRVGVNLVNGRYMLDGNNRFDGEHGGSARCMWYD